MPRIKTKHREEARNQIIVAALAVATEKGWDAVTLDAIAQHVGVTKPALYSYFENREALLRDVLFEVFQNIVALLEPTIAHDDDIHRIIRNLAELFFEQQKPYANLFFQIPIRMIHDQKSGEEFSRIIDTCRGIIHDSLVRAQAGGGLSHEIDPDESTNAIILMAMGIHVGSSVMDLDANTAKMIWITSVEKLLLIEPVNGNQQ
ncbi:MAG: TetR/AcrR family transcriptional regulator [Methanoregula sp.]|nr:TetR/AcrR family transcriptional regulator [Methanoregula sp.]